MNTIRSIHEILRPVVGPAAILLAPLLGFWPADLAGQEDIQIEPERVVTVSRGSTAILTRPDSIRRISVSDPAIAEPVVIPPNQVLINARQVGSTSVVIWGRSNIPQLYTFEVTADIASIQRQLNELFPEAGVRVTSTGSSIVLSGQVRDPNAVRKASELAETLGIPVVNNIQAPPAEQILLQVEFAEVSKSAMKELGTDLLRVLNPYRLDEAFDIDNNPRHEIETLAEGFVNIMISGEDSRLDAAIRLLKNNGEFRSLAQPNLVTREGEEASFLAGGEFPFPTIQGGNNQTVTITWKEFGIRLNFLPTITNAGNVRLRVEPEVSSLDFANGLTFSGFQVPSILARRVNTDVELQPGQTLAIGGLLDNTISQEVDKIPVLGDLPILGFFFRSESARESRTELLVLVTPYILDPNDLPAPPLPAGPALEWDWDSYIGEWLEERMDSVGLVAPIPASR